MFTFCLLPKVLAVSTGDVLTFNTFSLVVQSVAFETEDLVEGGWVGAATEPAPRLAVDVGPAESPAPGALSNEHFVLQSLDRPLRTLDEDEPVASKVFCKVTKQVLEAEAKPSC